MGIHMVSLGKTMADISKNNDNNKGGRLHFCKAHWPLVKHFSCTLKTQMWVHSQLGYTKGMFHPKIIIKTLF
jgi:hypothetical protein